MVAEADGETHMRGRKGGGAIAHCANTFAYSAGLRNMGMASGEHIGIYTVNCAEWVRYVTMNLMC